MLARQVSSPIPQQCLCAGECILHYPTVLGPGYLCMIEDYAYANTEGTYYGVKVGRFLAGVWTCNQNAITKVRGRQLQISLPQHCRYTGGVYLAFSYSLGPGLHMHNKRWRMRELVIDILVAKLSVPSLSKDVWGSGLLEKSKFYQKYPNMTPRSPQIGDFFKFLGETRYLQFLKPYPSRRTLPIHFWPFLALCLYPDPNTPLQPIIGYAGRFCHQSSINRSIIRVRVRVIRVKGLEKKKKSYLRILF